jgi:WD40 repeat protein
MSKTTDGFTDRMKSALNRLLRIGTNGPPSSSRRGRRLAPLQELEDRRLLSASPIGGEYRVNTYTAGAQQTFAQTPKAVAMNPANGNYVVVWSSQGQNGGTGYDVYFQRYNAAGVAQGPETLVDTPINGVNQAFANVAMNASGNFVVTWSSQQGGNWNIYAQQYNASGVAQGAAILVDTPGNFDQENSAIAMNASGNFVVTWQAGQNGYWEIYANVFNSSGVSQTGPIQLTSGANNYVVPQVAMDDAGQYVITWLSYAGGINWNVNAELFGSNNQPIGSEFQVNTLTTEDSFPAVAMDATGNFTITWTGAQTGIDNVYARSYFSTGAANGTVFQVGPASIESQAFSSVAFAGDGNPIITWSNEGLGISGWGIYAQQFTPTGTPLGSELHVNTYTLNDQVYSSVAGAADGNFTIVWSSQGEDGSGFGVYGQNFTTGASAGINVAGSTFLVSEDNNVLRINSLTGAVVATYPTGVANDGAIFGPDGSIYVADYANNQILHYNAAGTFLSSFGSADLTTPQALSFGPDGNLYVGNADGAVDKFSPTGTFLGTFIAAGSGGLTNAKAIVWGPNGNAYVSSYFNSEVLEYNGTTGAFIKVFATGSGGFEDIAFGPDGNLYAASYGNNAIYLYNGTTGASLGTFASGSQLDNPFGLSFDPNGNLDVASRSSGTIQVYNGTTRAFLGNLDTGLTNPAYLSTTTSLVTSETGTTATFTVVLTSEPLAPVTINLATSVADEGSLSQSTLTFTPSNWNVAQTVTVTGLDDHIVHGDQTYEITGTATSSDSNYNGLAMAPVYVTNTEADVAGFTVTPTSIQTSMSGASASFSVVMTSEPVTPVTIPPREPCRRIRSPSMPATGMSPSPSP